MVSGIGFIAVSSRETLEVRILVLIGIFVFAFFKFTWSLRQFTHADAVCLGADAGGEGCAGPGNAVHLAVRGEPFDRLRANVAVFV